VQSSCIPQALLGDDILCQAKSGMGKTAVFVLSILQQLDPAKVFFFFFFFFFFLLLLLLIYLIINTFIS
jgi:hypothetical protein